MAGGCDCRQVSSEGPLNRRAFERERAEQGPMAPNSLTGAWTKELGLVLLTTEELAKELGCSARTVKRMVAEGRIPVVRVGRRLARFDLEQVLARLKAQEEEPPRRGRPRKKLALGRLV